MVKVKGASASERKAGAAAKRVAKAPAKTKAEPKAAEPVVTPDSAVAPRAARREALESERERVAAARPVEPKAPNKADVETADFQESIGRHPGGMEPPVSEEARKAALVAQFAAADMVGDPRTDEIAAGLAVRGY